MSKKKKSNKVELDLIKGEVKVISDENNVAEVFELPNKEMRVVEFLELQNISLVVRSQFRNYKIGYRIEDKKEIFKIMTSNERVSVIPVINKK